MFIRQRSNKTIFQSVFILGGNSEIAKQICLNLVQKGTKKIHFVCRKPFKNNLFIKRLNDEFNLKDAKILGKGAFGEVRKCKSNND